MTAALSNDPIGEFRDAVALWSAEAWTHEELVEAACDALIAGVDSPGLRELAGVFRLEAHYEVPRLLPIAAEELGVEWHARGSKLGRIAGCRAMARLCLFARMAPKDLAGWAHFMFQHGENEAIEPLLGLSDAYEIVSYTGVRQEEIDEQVRAACRGLLETEP